MSSSINMTEVNARLFAGFAEMCANLNARITNVRMEWSDDGIDNVEWMADMEWSDEEDDRIDHRIQYIRGDVERIGCNGVFEFVIDEFENSVTVETGFYWNGDMNAQASTIPFVPHASHASLVQAWLYRAAFVVYTTREPGRHMSLESVLRLTASPGPRGLMWIDHNPESLLLTH